MALGLLALSTAVTWWLLAYRPGLPERARLSDPAGPIVTFVLSPDGARLATTAEPRTGTPLQNVGRRMVKVWDAATLRPRAGWVSSGALGGWVKTFSPDGRLVAGYTFNTGPKVLVWEAATGTRAAEFAIAVPSMYRLHDLVFAPDGATLTLCVQHCVGPTKQPIQVILWDTTTWQERGRSQFPAQRVNHAVFSADRRTLATGSERGELRLWDVASSQPVASLEGGPGDFVAGLAFSPDGTKLVSSYNRGGMPRAFTIYVWDLATRRPLAKRLASVNGLVFSPDGRRLAGTGVRLRGVVPESMVAVRALQAVGGSAWVNEVQLWDIAADRDWVVQSEPLEKSQRVPSVAFSPDGTSLVTTTGDGSLRFWSMPAIDRRTP
jgi:WD40 repeat protein